MAQNGIPKQYVQVGLTKGLNLKRDTHQLQNGELLTADNVVYSAVDGQVTKRFGYQQVTPQGQPFAGGPFTAIGCRDDKEPIVLGQNSLSRYNVAQNITSSLPLAAQGRLSISQVASSSGKTKFPWPPCHSHVAVDDAGRYACLVWEEPNSLGAFLYYGVQDLASGNWIVSPQTLVNPCSTYSTFQFLYYAQPQINYSNGFFYVSFLWNGYNGDKYATYVFVNTLDVTNISGGFYAPPTFAQLPYAIQVAQNSNSVHLVVGGSISYDFHVSAGRYALAFCPDTAFGRTSTIGTSVGTVSGRVFTQVKYADLALPAGLSDQSSAQYSTIRVSAKANGPADKPYGFSTAVRAWVVDAKGVSTQYTPGQTYAGNYYPGSPVDFCFNGSAVYFTSYGNDSNNVGCMYLYVTDKTFQSVKQIRCSPPVGSYLVEQLSRLFVRPNGHVCFWVGGGSNTSDDSYNSAYLLEVDPASAADAKTVARTLYQSNYKNNNFDKTTPCEVFQVPATQQFVTFISQGNEKSTPPLGASWRAYGTLNRVVFDYSPARQVQVVSLPTGGNLIAGALPAYYDGNEIVEAGFSAAPDYTANAPGMAAYTTGTGQPAASTSGGSMAAQTYTYLACFARRDAYGNVTRSAASSPITVTIASGSTGSVSFRPLYYSGGGNVRVEYYRNTPTLAGQGTYYFVGNAPVLTAASTVYSTFVDTFADASITGSRSYNLAETPNDPPPAVYHMAVSDTRAYCIPADNRNQVWASKLFTPARTVEWNSSQYLTEGQNAGLFTGLAVLDANVIVFKADSICYFYGTGPDNSGANGGFSPLQRLATDVGCIDAASIKVTPDGVVFRSRRGIELLTRSLQIVYIGNNVEPLVQTMGDFSSVVIMPNYTELRFVPAGKGQPVLCYDYGQKRWSTFGAGATGLSSWASVQAVNIQGQYWWIAQDGSTVNIETQGQYLDAGQPVVMTLETSEVPVGSAGAVGWGRLYRMALLGDFYTGHALTVSFQYDHQGSYTDSVVFDTAHGLIPGDTVYQFRCSRVPRQRMQSVRFRFQDSAITGQSCAISTLVLEVGDKGGLARLPAAKTL
jgi:hypothetical protein